jgi:hypothetical protein
MDLNARKDHFSRAIVRAVAATAGIKATIPELDEDSEDITFKAPDTEESPGAMLSAQLKCSQNVTATGGQISYDLPVKNYNDLRWPSEEMYVPRILIVVHVPSDPQEWMESGSEEITLRRCAYWVSLAGWDPISNTSTVAIKIPIEQVFDADALRAHLAPPGAEL